MTENTTGNITTEEYIDRRGFATCWWCGHKLIWQNDYDREDFGFSGEGMVTVLICSGCDAEVRMIGVDEEEEEGFGVCINFETCKSNVSPDSGLHQFCKECYNSWASAWLEKGEEE